MSENDLKAAYMKAFEISDEKFVCTDSARNTSLVDTSQTKLGASYKKQEKATSFLPAITNNKASCPYSKVVDESNAKRKYQFYTRN